MLPITRLLKRDLLATIPWKSTRWLSTASSTHPARRLEGKVAFITGGASGIGEAMAKLFAAEGAKVIIADIQDDTGSSLAANLGEDRAEYRHCDVTKELDIEQAVAAAISSHGKLDVMINNAAIPGKFFSSVTDLEMEEFDRLIAVNLRGVLLGTKHAARAMIPAKRGSIICTASVFGMLGLTGAAMLHTDSISKSGVIGLVRTAAAELRQHGIRVNAISPYAIPNTPLFVRAFLAMTPELTPQKLSENCDKLSGFYGAQFRPLDVARAAVFLASEEAWLISGHNLVVDGAFSACKDFNPLSV